MVQFNGCTIPCTSSRFYAMGQLRMAAIGRNDCTADSGQGWTLRSSDFTNQNQVLKHYRGLRFSAPLEFFVVLRSQTEMDILRSKLYPKLKGEFGAKNTSGELKHAEL